MTTAGPERRGSVVNSNEDSQNSPNSQKISLFRKNIQEGTNKAILDHFSPLAKDPTELEKRKAGLSHGLATMLDGLNESLSFFTHEQIGLLHGKAKKVLQKLQQDKKIDEDETKNFNSFLQRLEFVESFLRTKGEIPKQDLKRMLQEGPYAAKIKEKVSDLSADFPQEISEDELDRCQLYYKKVYSKDIGAYKAAALSDSKGLDLARELIEFHIAILNDPERSKYTDRLNDAVKAKTIESYPESSRQQVEALLDKYPSAWKSSSDKILDEVNRNIFTYNTAKQDPIFSLEQQLIQKSLSGQTNDQLIEIYNSLKARQVSKDEKFPAEIGNTKTIVLKEIIHRYDALKTAKERSLSQESKPEDVLKSQILKNVTLEDLQNLTLVGKDAGKNSTLEALREAKTEEMKRKGIAIEAPKSSEKDKLRQELINYGYNVIRPGSFIKNVQNSTETKNSLYNTNDKIDDVEILTKLKEAFVFPKKTMAKDVADKLASALFDTYAEFIVYGGKPADFQKILLNGKTGTKYKISDKELQKISVECIKLKDKVKEESLEAIKKAQKAAEAANAAKAAAAATVVATAAASGAAAAASAAALVASVQDLIASGKPPAPARPPRPTTLPYDWEEGYSPAALSSVTTTTLNNMPGAALDSDTTFNRAKQLAQEILALNDTTYSPQTTSQASSQSHKLTPNEQARQIGVRFEAWVGGSSETDASSTATQIHATGVDASGGKIKGPKPPKPEPPHRTTPLFAFSALPPQETAGTGDKRSPLPAVLVNLIPVVPGADPIYDLASPKPHTNGVIGRPKRPGPRHRLAATRKIKPEVPGSSGSVRGQN